ncbi:MAG TPA: hypothetical protein VNV17_06885 [Solirubrobacteraceae bacterium]|jgi:hypothetical protein|nr:hypothetical protein [Solirubrobacteraceae bacterium]
MERSDLPYLLLGATTAAQRRSRGVVALGVRAAGIAAGPPVAAWRSPIAAPLRRRAGDASAALTVSGRDTAGRVRSSAGVATGYRVRHAGERVLRSGLLEEVVDRLLCTVAFDHAVTVVTNHPATERMLARALEDPGGDRLVSPMLDDRMLDEVTTSPSALTQPAASRSS